MSNFEPKYSIAHLGDVFDSETLGYPPGSEILVLGESDSRIVLTDQIRDTLSFLHENLGTYHETFKLLDDNASLKNKLSLK